MVKYILFSWMNLIVAIALPLYYFRKPLLRYFSERSKKIKTQIEQAVSSLKIINHDYKLWHEKSQNVEAEIQQILKEAEVDSERLGKKIVEEAEVFAERIMEQALMRAQNEVRKRAVSFYAKVVDKSIETATSSIKNTISLEKQIATSRAYLEQIMKQ